MKIFRRNKPADKPAEPADTAPPDGAQGELALADPTPAPRRPWPLRHKRITALLALLAVGAAAALALRRFLPARAEAEYQYILRPKSRAYGPVGLRNAPAGAVRRRRRHRQGNFAANCVRGAVLRVRDLP